MKKLTTIVLTLIIAFTMTACGGGEGNVTPEYAQKFTYDYETHWRAQTNGNGRTDVADHVDDGTGVCPVCKYIMYVNTNRNPFLYDDTMHWKRDSNGVKSEEGYHVEDSGKCAVCDYYYDATEFLEFERCTINGVAGYRVAQLLEDGYDEDYIYRNIEIPAYYQGEGDEKPLPVISIGYGALSTGNVNGRVYNTFRISSVKLNEGLLEIRDWAFKGTDLTSLSLPNSCTNEFFKNSGTANTYGAIYNLCGNRLDRFETGGAKVLASYNFANGTKEVILGDGLEQIKPRAFYEIYSLEYLVIPASVNKIPEGTVTGTGDYAKAPLIRMFPNGSATKIFMEITKQEHDALLLSQRKRDLQGNVLDPLPANTIGFVKGWSGNNPIYFKGEWTYNKWGKPEPIV